ncbi:hypothetical protein FRC07_008461 [Ceratobasidium sp. 392]|nr:hypothetical protein FRC07_008461 [Ceratobasidium sp. 392]
MTVWQHKPLDPKIEEIRKEFCKRFGSNRWNHPSKAYSHQIKDEPAKSKALVIVIQYTQENWTPGAFVDAMNILDTLETQFNYPPQCIRVLADQALPGNERDEELWPTKDNIIEGLKWLGEDLSDDSECRRVLYFTGFGYTPGLVEDASGAATVDAYLLNMLAGILPVDFEIIVAYGGLDMYLIPETALLNWELNNYLVDSLGDKKVNLTAIFDLTLKGGTIEFDPEDLNRITRHRGRGLAQTNPATPKPNKAPQESNAIVGNLLGEFEFLPL